MAPTSFGGSARWFFSRLMKREGLSMSSMSGWLPHGVDHRVRCEEDSGTGYVDGERIGSRQGCAYDVVIVGAGLAGVSLAYELATQLVKTRCSARTTRGGPFRIALLDRESAAAGATGLSMGTLFPLYHSSSRSNSPDEQQGENEEHVYRYDPLADPDQFVCNGTVEVIQEVFDRASSRAGGEPPFRWHKDHGAYLVLPRRHEERSDSTVQDGDKQSRATQSMEGYLRSLYRTWKETRGYCVQLLETEKEVRESMFESGQKSRALGTSEEIARGVANGVEDKEELIRCPAMAIYAPRGQVVDASGLTWAMLDLLQEEVAPRRVAVRGLLPVAVEFEFLENCEVTKLSKEVSKNSKNSPDAGWRLSLRNDRKDESAFAKRVVLANGCEMDGMFQPGGSLGTYGIRVPVVPVWGHVLETKLQMQSSTAAASTLDLVDPRSFCFFSVESFWYWDCLRSSLDVQMRFPPHHIPGNNEDGTVVTIPEKVCSTLAGISQGVARHGDEQVYGITHSLTRHTYGIISSNTPGSSSPSSRILHLGWGRDVDTPADTTGAVGGINASSVDNMRAAGLPDAVRHVGESLFSLPASVDPHAYPSYSGRQPFSVYGRPLVGELAEFRLPGLYLAGGFGPAGVKNAPFLMKLLAAEIAVQMTAERKSEEEDRRVEVEVDTPADETDGDRPLQAVLKLYDPTFPIRRYVADLERCRMDAAAARKL